MERFFSLDHLSTERLHELYGEACKLGRQIIEYDEEGIEGHHVIRLSEEMILENISRDNHHYLVYQQGFDDDDDVSCIRISFELSDYSFIHVYIEMDHSHLKRLVTHYSLDVWRQSEDGRMVEHPFCDFELPELNHDMWDLDQVSLN